VGRVPILGTFVIRDSHPGHPPIPQGPSAVVGDREGASGLARLRAATNLTFAPIARSAAAVSLQL